MVVVVVSTMLVGANELVYDSKLVLLVTCGGVVSVTILLLIGSVAAVLELEVVRSLVDAVDVVVIIVVVGSSLVVVASFSSVIKVLGLPVVLVVALAVVVFFVVVGTNVLLLVVASSDMLGGVVGKLSSVDGEDASCE